MNFVSIDIDTTVDIDIDDYIGEIDTDTLIEELKTRDIKNETISMEVVKVMPLESVVDDITESIVKLELTHGEMQTLIKFAHRIIEEN